ncbi:MAG: sigma-70 family RNA polymerase sigma factor, partial [Bacilli bacterium]|nr:sigma-70 family RNA polymerase sigma factor [Bacilli bacterium]
IEMIAKELGLTEYEVSHAIDSMKDTISMFEPIYNDGGDTIYLADQLGDGGKNHYAKEVHIALNEALNKLKDKEKYIVYSRYIVGKTQMELAEEIGISQAQISRLEKSALESIKKMID